MTTAVLSLGSNLGDRVSHLRGAIAGLPAVKVSGIYETPPWGDADQPAYLNAVVIADDPSITDPLDWLALAQRLEQEAGRERDPERRFGPRTLDVDVIVVRDERLFAVREKQPLVLPHPRAHLRAFVLVPWAEIDPDAELAGHGKIVALLRQEPVASDVSSVRLADTIGRHE